MPPANPKKPSPTRREFTRAQWLDLYQETRKSTDLLQPLSRLLHLDRTASRPAQKRPYIIGVSGSVAVGKSSFSKDLSTTLTQWDDQPVVKMVTTDSFIYPLKTLEARGLILRKGFPESYDRTLIFEFLRSTRLGCIYKIPIYCHRKYDIVEGQFHEVHRPDIVILEGLDVCQMDNASAENILDYVDFSIYLDAPEELIKSWYVERFICLQAEALKEQMSYFSKFRDLSFEEASSMASQRWDQINSVNLREHIYPSSDNADLIIRKSEGHKIDQFRLRSD